MSVFKADDRQAIRGYQKGKIRIKQHKTYNQEPNQSLPIYQRY